jgi:hypothetical protein
MTELFLRGTLAAATVLCALATFAQTEARSATLHYPTGGSAKSSVNATSLEQSIRAANESLRYRAGRQSSKRATVAPTASEIQATADLATSRIAMLESLIAADSLRAAELLFSNEEIKSLKQYANDIAIETRIDNAVFSSVVFHYDDFDNKRSWNEYFADYEGEQLKFANVEGLTGIRNRQELVAARAARVGGTLLSLTDVAFVPESQAATTRKSNRLASTRVALLMVNFTNDRSRPWTKAQVETEMTQSVAWFNEVSFGKQATKIDVFGWYEAPVSNATCDTFVMKTEAIKLAVAAGVDLSGYNIVGFVFPRIPTCGWAGLGGGRSNIWLNGYTGVWVTAHEIGHVLGFDHATAWRCSDGDHTNMSQNPNCVQTEYGSPYDTLGVGVGHFHAGMKRKLDYLGDPSVTQGARSVARSGDYDLLPYASSAIGLKAIAIPRFSNGDGSRNDELTRMHVEYRQAVGSDATLGSAIGNHVQLTIGDNDLLDLTPNTETHSDASLVLNAVFNEPQSGTKLTLIAANAQKATVRVELDPCGRTLPLVRVVDSTPYALVGQLKRLQIFVTNLDSPARCSTSTTFRLSIEPFATEPLLAHTIIGTNPRAIAPGASTMFEVDFQSNAAAKDFYASVTNTTRTRYTQRTQAQLAASPAYQLAIVSGDNQSAPISGSFATQPRVRVTNASSAGVTGVRVEFIGPSTFIANGVCITDANGECGVNPRATSVPGSYVYRATSGIARPVDFRLTNTAATSPPLDTSPASFSFADLAGVGLAIPLISERVIINGINTDVPVSVTNGEYSVGCTGVFTTTPGTIRENQAVCVRQISAATSATLKTTRLTVGSVFGEFITRTATFPSDAPGVKVCALDADGDGRVEAMTDGLLIYRHMTNPANVSTLTNGIAIPANAQRKSGADIAAFLANSDLDLYGDMKVDRRSDGLLLLRSLLGFTGTSVTDGSGVPHPDSAPFPLIWDALRHHLRTNCGLASKIR